MSSSNKVSSRDMISKMICNVRWDFDDEDDGGGNWFCLLIG